METLSREQLGPICILDGDLFGPAFCDDTFAGIEAFLQAVLKKPDLSVIDMQARRARGSLQRTVLEILASDTDGLMHRILLQKSEPGGSPGTVPAPELIQRRRHRAPSDSMRLYSLLLSEADTAGLGLPFYRTKTAPADSAGEETVLVINGTYRGDDDLGRILEDLREADPDQMHNAALAARMRFLKDTEEGRKLMSEALEAVIQARLDAYKKEIIRQHTEELQTETAARKQAESALESSAAALWRLAKARQDEVTEIARRLLAKGMDPLEAAEVTNLPAEEIASLSAGI